MKYVKTFEEFINEKYNVDEAKKESPSPREYKHISGKENKIKLAIKDVEKTARLKINRGKEPEYEQLSLNKIMLSKVLGREKLGKEHVKAWKKLMKEYDLKESFVNEGAYSLLNFFQEMQSFDAAGVTTDDIKRASEPKNIKKTEKNNRELKSLLRDWSNGTYDEDPDALVRELRYLLESEDVNESFNKKSAMKAMSKFDDAILRTKDGDEYLIYNPDNGNDDNTADWKANGVMGYPEGEAEGDGTLIKYSDIKSILNEDVNEKSSADNALLQKMFKALKRSKNFKSVKMGKPYDQDDWDGATINIVSKLKGEDDRHKDDFDEFEIGIDIDGGIVMIYEPSGNDTEIESVADVMTLTRANEGYVSEGTTPTFKRLIKMAKSNGIETVDELDDLIQDEFSDAEPFISGADYEIAKKKLRLTESSTLKTYEEFINEAKVMSKKDIDKLVKELVADGRHGDDAAFDIADGILFDEEGLEAGIKKHYRVSDVQGWLADRIA
jgi:hypothetical protein